MPDPANPTQSTPSLQGEWRNVTPGIETSQYPAKLVFDSARYRGTRAEGQGMIWWDAGTFRLADDETLVLSTATDELVKYQISLGGDRFVVTDPAGVTVTYERIS
ncbi:hypothetical protein [Mycetocola miduiensis]|uniref:Lipocalin-like domain-containing protein n=1 Tax=Mycetocola miduiensis TaxID=995034 RepID=A0A1I4ZG92_9MICO|nr:hypothetical protein [Mycetocola miduiensis]SFN49177.1 hypothetical protein SAMN05216219_0787 [Mycetocola miduiensis]